MTLEYLHQTMLSFKGMHLCSVSKNGFHQIRFHSNFLKVFKKRRTELELNQNKICPNLKRETGRKKQTDHETVVLFQS